MEHNTVVDRSQSSPSTGSGQPHGREDWQVEVGMPNPGALAAHGQLGTHKAVTHTPEASSEASGH